ncbi:MAG TPA: hypothetical protein VI072_29455 [Polyangiaceae bacterium]
MCELPVQRHAIDSEDTRGSGLVAPDGLQHSLDVTTLYFLEARQLQGLALNGERRTDIPALAVCALGRRATRKNEQLPHRDKMQLPQVAGGNQAAA